MFAVVDTIVQCAWINVYPNDNHKCSDKCDYAALLSSLIGWIAVSKKATLLSN